jgi:heterogeneous nuclear ribonucleoprotein L
VEALKINEIHLFQEVIYTICHPHGNVLRIVIFKKNGVQAMVEFDSIESATRARENLNGCDIYSSCCTLKIDYAKVRNLIFWKPSKNEDKLTLKF